MLTIDHIEKRYSDFKLALSLSLPTGKIIGVLGPNGAGKSTFFKLLLNLSQPDTGRLTIDSQPLSTWVNHHPTAISATFPDSGFNEKLTVTEINHLLTTFYSKTMTPDFIMQCQQLNLPLNQAISHFSTGMQAKLKCLVALSHAATLVILDEPTSGLDVTVRQTIITLIRRYHDHYPQATILISSHIASDIEALAEQVALITNGSLSLQADLTTIQQDYGLFTVSEAQFSQLDQTQISHHWSQNNQVTCLTTNRAAFTDIVPVKVPTIDELLLKFTTKQAVMVV
ncbi:ABC transporter ATP-binding protein [Lactiplantibacillus paraxiangfangensis]|uniref:ABC transporter ATP-binding protein n=1 Tax=Lactiplantibacillus paraxiangfangensis TaxID=3076224 RepID=UPI0030C671EB